MNANAPNRNAPLLALAGVRQPIEPPFQPMDGKLVRNYRTGGDAPLHLPQFEFQTAAGRFAVISTPNSEAAFQEVGKRAEGDARGRWSSDAKVMAQMSSITLPSGDVIPAVKVDLLTLTPANPYGSESSWG